MPDSSPLLISTLPPSRTQRRAAFAVCAGLVAVFVLGLAFANTPLPLIAAVIPVVSAFMFLGDCVSAVLLFGQFAVMRTRALLVLAGGYLFTGLLVVPYALTFPGAFSESGLFGAGIQTAAWIFVFWHLGLPATVMAYALLRDARPSLQVVRAPVGTAIAATACAAVVLAAAVAWFAIALNDLLPRLAVDTIRLSRQEGVLASVVCLSVAAVIMLAKQRRSVLDLWLLVVTFAWLLDSVLTSLTESRYTGAWYANRVIRIVAANVVLFVLVAESTKLYARIAASIIAQRRERETRVMTMEAMSAAIEHEVRQPLAAIAANAAAAQRWMDHSPANVGEAREAVGAIEEDAARATDILHSVRQLFAKDAGKDEAVDVNALIGETIAVARSDLDRSAVGVHLQLAPRLPPVEANRRQLEEVILNLVHNAAEAMRDVTDNAAVLSIASAPAGAGRIEITIADSGAGIDAKHMDRIFEPFFTTKPDGMGMGLAICRSIVERHGGTLTVSQGTPYGCVFRMVLPTG